MLTQYVTPERCESSGESDENLANLFLHNANRRDRLFFSFRDCQFFM